MLLSGEAENLFDEEAQQAVPLPADASHDTGHADQGHRFQPLSPYAPATKSPVLTERITLPETFSPYNPPIRLLASELKELGKTAYVPSASSGDASDQPSSALLVRNRRISSRISSFSFQLDKPLKGYLPGTSYRSVMIVVTPFVLTQYYDQGTRSTIVPSVLTRCYDASYTSSSTAPLVLCQRKDTTQSPTTVPNLVPRTATGSYIILDFSSALDLPYMHMNQVPISLCPRYTMSGTAVGYHARPGNSVPMQAAPQLVNDDLIRTWSATSLRTRSAISGTDVLFCTTRTISALDAEARTVACTIKNVPTGTVSPILHSITDPAKVQMKSLKVVGSGGDFSCFSNGRAPGKMVWGAGTVRILVVHHIAQQFADADVKKGDDARRDRDHAVSGDVGGAATERGCG
eukprot:2457978-Rhodomonas_salina.2